VLANPAAGADLKVTSAGAVRGLMARIIDDYSRQTGQKFEFTVGTTGQLRAIIGSGFPADLIITSAPLMGSWKRPAISPAAPISVASALGSRSATGPACRT